MEGENDLPPSEAVDDTPLQPEVAEAQDEAPEGGDIQPDEQSISIDDLAIEMGWTPKDRWRGDPDKWKPAPDFVRTTVDVNRNLYGKVRELSSQVENMARTSAQMTELAVAQAREQIMRERQEAFDMGDLAAFEAADKKLERLEVPQAPAVVPEAQAFVEKHSSWWGKDQEATRWAVAKAEEYSRMGLSPARQLQAVEADLEKVFPDLLPKREPAPKPAPLNRPGQRATTTRPKGFADLPEAVKAAALDYQRRIGIDPEEYAKTYFAQGAGA